MRLIDAVTTAEKISDKYNISLEELVDIFAEIPTVDAQPVVHAKWVISSDGYYPYCKNCNARPKCGEMTKYCPECGARMGGDE